jgi:nucleoside-diphosphate-sugar epimerase
MSISTQLLSDDLDYILKNTLPLWEKLRGQRIFITGGTGFFGCWLLESFVWANIKLKLNASAVVLTRDASQFSKKCPHLFLEPSLTFHEGDIRSFTFPYGDFSHVIHAATEANVGLNKDNPELMFDTIVQGTKHTLDFAKQCRASRFFKNKTGGVCGKPPSSLSHIPEDYVFQIDETKSAYADGKRESENICALYAEQYNLDIKIARCFAFVGPYLPLDTHFAIGNFIRDALNKDSIVVKSNGTPYRSYLYAADLAIWLWTILFCGKKMRPYNVGSDESITIKDLAYMVAAISESKIDVKIEQPVAAPLSARYVPDINRARSELSLSPKIGLKQAIKSTQEWHLSKDY